MSAWGMLKPFSPGLMNSGIQPSAMLRFTEPFMAAVMPLVPLASRGNTGVFSQMSDPFFMVADRASS